jgi:hypothetical protein
LIGRPAARLSLLLVVDNGGHRDYWCRLLLSSHYHGLNLLAGLAGPEKQKPE